MSNSIKTVLIIGAGEGGMKLLDIFMDDPNHKVVGVVDKNRIKSAMDTCGDLGIPYSMDLESFLINYYSG